MKSQGNDENLKQNTSIPKNGRLSRCIDLALIPRWEALDQGVDTRPQAPRSLRFL
jgi:hypothetical protein